MTPPLTLRPPAPDDAAELLQFELDNRAYFESWINARSPDYYALDAVRRAIDTAADERARDVSHQFLVHAGPELVGRANLHRVARPYYNKAELGYRIGERFGGQGYASRAVALLVQHAFEALEFHRIEATVRTDNRGSLRVLHKNGFREFGRSTRSMQLQGRWYDLAHLDLHNERLAATAR